MLDEFARRGTVTAVAAALHYTSSAVSQQLAALEAEVGVPLLERVGRRVRLTEMGHVVAEQAREILAVHERARATIERAHESLTGQLSVSVFATVAGALLPPALTHLAEQHPGIRVTTREADPEDAVVDLRNGDLDLAFLVDYPDAPEAWKPGLRTTILGSERLHLAVPRGRHISDVPVELSTLADESWIVSGPHTYYGRAVRAACQRAGFDPSVIHQVDEQATAMAMVAAGLGITPVSDLGEIFRPNNVSVIALTPPIRRQFMLAYRPDAFQRPALRALLSSVETAATELGLTRPSAPS